MRYATRVIALTLCLALFGGDCTQPMPDIVPAPSLFAVTPPPFVVVVSADRLSGVPGTSFKLNARIAADAFAIQSYSWTINGGDVASTDAAPEFSFDAPGDYVVDVAIRNDQGDVVTDGTLIKVFDPDESTSSSSQIVPDAGMPGALVQIQSPVLDDSTAVVHVMIGDGAAFEPYRPALGLANFLIPFDAADGFSQSEVILIQLLVDNQERDRFDFALSPAASSANPPGTVARRWLQEAPGLVTTAENDLLAFLGNIDAGLTTEEQALVRAFLQFVRTRMEQVRDVAIPQIDALDDATRAQLDQAMIANGATLADLDKLAALAKRIHTNKNAKDEVLDLLCRFHDLVDDLKRAIDALSVAAYALPVLALEAAGSVVAPAIMALSNAIGELNTAKSTLLALADLVPRVQDGLEVTATPDHLMHANEKAVIQVKAKLATKVDICRQALDELVKYLSGKIANEVFADLVGIIPSNRLARLAYVHGFNNYGPNVSVGDNIRIMQEIRQYLGDIASNLAAAILTAPQIDSLLMAIKIKLCALEERGTLTLQPEESILKQLPGGAGTFLNLQDESIDFYCSINTQGVVTIRAERECGFGRAGGSPRKLTGETTITCGQESCLEDASGSIQVEVLPTSSFSIPSHCGFLQQRLSRQDATITVRNLHPTRSIRIAAVKYRKSDSRNLTRGPCEGDNIPTGLTVGECVNSRTAGCNSGFRAFLSPNDGSDSFHTSEPIPFICAQEFVYTPPDSDGTCGESVIETVKEHWVIQAVFCDNAENAEEFCTQMDLTMTTFGMPSANWSAVEKAGCQ